jgi:signal transduction histidine kinase
MKISDISPAAAIPLPQAPPRAPPAVGAQPVACGSMAGSMEAIRLLADEHVRIAHGLNDVVVRRLFSAGLDLQAALNLIGDHHVAGKIERVLDELDLAIQDLRNTIFDHRAS